MNSSEVSNAIEKVLGVPGKYGAWWTARQLLKKIWFEEKRKPEVIHDTTFDLRELPFVQAAKDVAWKRELQFRMIGWYVHHFDKNCQYLSADRGMYTGIGDPVHLNDGDDNTFIEPKLPGIYRVTFSALGSIFDGTRYPYIIEPGQHWVTRDVLLFAQKQGYKVDVHEAWVFPDYTRVLDEWASRIWNGRAAFKGVNEGAYKFMKEVAIVGNGAWATNAQRHPGLDLIHPNWWCDTVGKARTALLANLLTYGAPILIETDGLYFVSRDPNPYTAVLSHEKGVSILSRENESGGYKYKGSFVLTEKLYEQSQGLNPGKLATLFKGAINVG